MTIIAALRLTEETTMKKTIVTISAMACLYSACGLAEPQYEWAKVLQTDPITRLVRIQEPREVCWDEEVTHVSGPSKDTSTVVGGILGGLVGNQFGKGHGRDAATVAGVLLGASIARDKAKRHGGHQYTNLEQRCTIEETVREEERIIGFRVTYRYQGETYTTRLDEDPGERLRVRVSVTPVP